jgi:hypothetical protein
MKKLILITVALIISKGAIADKKMICPDLANYTKTIELNNSTNMIAPDILYMHSGLNYLTSRQLWNITIGPVKGNRWESMETAKNMIKAINSPATVNYSEDMRRFYCAYPTEDESVYITVTTYDFDDIVSKNPQPGSW